MISRLSSKKWFQNHESLKDERVNSSQESSPLPKQKSKRRWVSVIVALLVVFCNYYSSCYSQLDSEFPSLHSLGLLSFTNLSTEVEQLAGLDLPLCQRTDQFVTFVDRSKGGAGLLHKLEDFYYACILAIIVDRTLIDYLPVLTRSHNRNLNGTERQIESTKFSHWKFSQLFDLDNLTYNYRRQKKKPAQNCRLSFIKEKPENVQSEYMLKLEYGFDGGAKKDLTSYRIRMLADNWASENHAINSDITALFSGKPPFSKFIRETAEILKNQMLATFGSQMGTKKLYVIHLRGTDRDCIVRLMTSSYLIAKIESHKITQKDAIYVMTDLGANHDKVTSLKRHFGDSLFVASDMKIFSQSPFKDDNYWIFAVELALQKISDGYLSTYKNHELLSEDNKIGPLMNMNCFKDTMDEMSLKKIKKLLSQYSVFGDR